MEGVFVFGSLGNTSSVLGPGWSVEEEFAWTTGVETTLTLPLPGDDRAYTLRFDLHPAVFPPSLDSQALTVAAAFKVLGTFELASRRSIVIPLPPALTAGRDRIRLQLLHPQAARPCDHAETGDSRRLGFCFHTGTLALTRAGEAASAHAEEAGGLEPLHGLIAGGAMANVLTEIFGKLPSLRDRLGFRVIDFNTPLDRRIAELPPDTLATAMFCWIDNRAGTPEQRDALRARLPESCAQLTFLTPHFRALWPFLATDPRARPEPGRYGDARYPQGDRLAYPLASVSLSDDVVYLMYEMAVEQETLDLDAQFAKEVRHMRREEATADIKLAQYIQDNLARERLFLTPYLPNTPLIRDIAWQMLNRPELHVIAKPETVAAELDALLEGFVPWDVELPVHARVARHFGLEWWRPELRYRWFNNYRTYREYTLDQIRWVQWRV